VTVANTGDREGEEVVQLYVSDLVASVARPETCLIGFTRLSLAPGEAVRVTFDVHPSRLAFYDEAMRFVLEPGLFRFAVGASCLTSASRLWLRSRGRWPRTRSAQLRPLLHKWAGSLPVEPCTA